MELVKQFNSELSSLYETKPPISKAKMTSITRTAIKAIKLYKHVVQSVEKFIQKCKPEYKVPGLYVIDSIVRQSRHQFGTEKDVFAPRFARNLQQTFVHLFNCPPEDKSKVIRVLNLWQKNSVFESEVIQPLFDLADPNHPVHREQAALAPSNGITPVKPPAANITPKNASSKKEGATTGWINQLNNDSHSSNQQKSHAPNQMVDVNLIQQLHQLQTLLLDQQTDKTKSSEADQIKFDKKLLDFDYGEEEDEDGPPTHHHQQQQQQQVVAGLDSLGSILSNPEVLRQLQTLQQTLSNPQHLRQQQHLEMEEKMRKMQEMRQQEEEFDKHLAQTVPNLPFADECELKPGGELAGFPGMDLSQPPPGYAPQQKLMVPPGMMMKPPPSPLEDGEHASSDADERMGRRGGGGVDGGPSVVVLDSDSPSDSPAHGRRRRRRSRSRSRSHHRRSRSDSRSRSRSKRKRSSSYDDKDWEKIKQREAEKERERERKRKGLPPLKKNHLAVCSTTLWIGHLSKLVQQEELSDTFGEFGDIVSIDLIPPRGCAFICMNRRQDAYRALQDLKHHKLQGKAITLAWAPGKGMKGKEYKDYWEVEQGVSYIPWIKLTPDIDLELLEEGGMIDEESMPDWLKERQKKNKDDEAQRSQSSSQAGDEDVSKGGDLDIPVPAPTLPGYIPLPDGPQPSDMKVNQPPPTMPPMLAPAPPPLGMMPPFAMPRLLGPMGMAMGPGLMPNVPLGVPPPGMQGLMGNPLMHQQMMSRMPQPVGSPFNPPPGVGLLGPQLSQIPLPGSQDKGKGGLASLGVPPPNDGSGMPSFSDHMMQIPFTLPPQLQMPGMGMLTRPHMSDKPGDAGDGSDKRDMSPPRSGAGMHFGQPPPQFSPMSLMKIPPPMTLPPPNKADGGNEDKDERELKDKDYRDTLKDFKDRDKERDRDRDYRNKRDRDYRGDRDYRDRFDKDYRDRDKDYREKDRDRKDGRRERSREREKDDKTEQDFRQDGKMDEKDRKDESLKEDKNYRDRNDRDRSRNRERDRDRDRGRDRKWGDRDRERGRDREREDRRGRDRERERSKEMKGGSERDKGGPNIQDRLRNMAHDQDRPGEFSRGGMEPDNFQGPPGGPKFGSRNEGFHQEGYPPEMHGRIPGGRRDGFDNRGPGPRDMFDHRGPPPDGFDPRGPPPEGFGQRGGPPMDNFGPRGPPPDGFGPRGPPPDGFDPRGPPPGGFGPDSFDPRGPPPDFDNQGPPPENFNMRGPPPDNFNRGPLIPDNFGPGGPPPDNFLRGLPGDEFNPHGPPFEGFGGPHGPPGEFQPRIRFELFSRGRGRGQDSFRGRGGRGGAIFSPRGGGPRGSRAGPWMESQGPSPPKPGFGFPPRGFPPPEGGPERFGPPVFEDSGRGRGGQNIRGRGRAYQGRTEDRRREDEEATSPSHKRLSRWSNPSPPPSFMPPAEESRVMNASNNKPEEADSAMDVREPQSDPISINDADKNPDNPFCPEDITPHVSNPVNNIEADMIQGSTEGSTEIVQPSVEVTAEVQPLPHSAVEESSFNFSGIDDDSCSMQLSTNDPIPERDTSCVFQQDSHSLADIEMSSSHFSFGESEQQSQQEELQASDIVQRKTSFADIEFTERAFQPQDNMNSSQGERQSLEMEEDYEPHSVQRLLPNEMQENIDFSFGDSVSSVTEQNLLETHLGQKTDYDPRDSARSEHFEERPSGGLIENTEPSNQQDFPIGEPRQNSPSYQEQINEDKPNFCGVSEPTHAAVSDETGFHVQENEMPAPPQSGVAEGDALSSELGSQEHNNSVENSEQ